MATLQQQIRELFKDRSPEVQQVIQKVLDIEQAQIDKQRPRVKDDIDRVLTEVAKAMLEKAENED